MTINKKRYNYMESVLQKIQRRYILVSRKDTKRKDEISKQIIETIVNKMKKKDELFDLLFTETFYSGTFYEGLEIKKPKVFNLHFQLQLPEMARPAVTCSNIPGFVNVQLSGLEQMLKTEAGQRYRKLIDFLDGNNYLLTTEVYSWMEKVIREAMNDFLILEDPQSFPTCFFKTCHGRFRASLKLCTNKEKLRRRRSLPLILRLKIRGAINKNAVKMDVNLFPSFHFGSNQWPPLPFLPNPIAKKPNFFVVPLRPYHDGNLCRHWKPSFQMQERELLKCHFHIKPTIKLLKKLLTYIGGDVIPNHYIISMFLKQTVEQEFDYWKNSQSYLFMTMLKKLRNYLKKGYIPDFWNEQNCLNAKTVHFINLANTLENIIVDIESEPDTHLVVAAHLLDINEFIDFRKCLP